MTGWISVKDWTEEDKGNTRRVLFRKVFTLKDAPDSFMIRISADTRYRLFINGSFVEYGPSKGDHHVWFYDEMDIASYLCAGENTAAVIVLHYPEDAAKGNHSMFRYDMPRLFVSGIDPVDWKYRIDRQTEFYAEEERFAPLQIHEKAHSENTAWRENDFDDSLWEEAVICDEPALPETLKTTNLKPRTIPFMRREKKVEMIADRFVPAGSEYTFVIDAEEEMTAFVSMALEGGCGSEIELLYSECYEYEQGKGRRTDSENGHLNGYRDFITVSEDAVSVFEPFWFRTFRYIQVSVHAKSDLTLKSFTYEETGYPLQVKSEVHVSDQSFGPIFDISLRSLKRCMQETYIDCPYYEQLQYVMDTRAQILYTYAVSADDRLARKAIDDFARGQRADGLLNCSCPDTNVNVIPGFSIYYILMVYDHMMYFGDVQLVEKYLPVIERILRFFESCLNEYGLVKKIGGMIGRGEFWSFIDWAKEWMETDGMPKAGLSGPVTLESELYLYGLIHAAELCDFVHDAKGDLYRKQAEVLKNNIRTYCIKDGMITDGPGVSDLSQQAQVFGVLSGILDPDEGRNALDRTVHDPSVAQCTVATSFYLFRALQETGLYEYTDHYWDIWRNMVRNECTTCVEGEYYPRSECHAWGALALYELPGVILGVRPAAPGYEKILVSPCAGCLNEAEGTVHTPVGDVNVSWKKTEDHLQISIDAEEDVRSRIITK